MGEIYLIDLANMIYASSDSDLIIECKTKTVLDHNLGDIFELSDHELPDELDDIDPKITITKINAKNGRIHVNI